MRKQPTYAYAPELPTPASIGDINMSNPLVRLVVKVAAHVSAKQIQKMGYKKLDAGVPTLVVEPDTTETLPAIVYCHGGGFMYPLQPMMVNLARYYSEQLHCRVFLPDYRIAPRYPFPVPFEDCLKSYRYLESHADELKIDPNRMILLGDSAGGCLAAAVCQKLRDEGKQLPICQVLLYPVTDNEQTYASIDQYANAVWSKSANRQMWAMYLKNGDHGLLSYVAPMHGDCRNLPRTYVEVCECDTLRDEGIAYYEKMRESGVRCELHAVKGAYHGYDSDVENPFVQKMLEQRVRFIRESLNLP